VLERLRQNCYIVGCETSKEAIVIDPGDDVDLIRRQLRAAGLICTIIVNTHGHVDHTAGNKVLAEATGAIIAIGAKDEPSLDDPTRNLSPAFANFAKDKISPPASLLLAEGDTLYAGSVCLEALETPGHTREAFPCWGKAWSFQETQFLLQEGLGARISREVPMTIL